MSKHHRSHTPWIVFSAIIVAVAILVTAGFLFFRKAGRIPFVGSVSSASQYEVGLLDKPSSLDIRTNTERAVEQVLLENVYETLVSIDNDGGISAQIAARWSSTTDGLQYTFTLRDGLTFADGSALDASAVVASLQQTITQHYVGSEDLTNISAIENSDDSTVVITLSAPNPRLLEVLAGRAGVIMNTRIANPDYEMQSYGSGPFVVSGISDSYITLSQNKKYHQAKPSATQITLRFFDDEQTMASALEDGTIDVALPQTSSIVEQLRANDSLAVTEGFSTQKVLVALNSKDDSPFSDQQVRQFTRYAINATDIAQTQVDAKEQLSGPISQLQPGYEDLNGLFPFDLNKASSMRAYFGGGYFQPFTLLADEAHADLAQTIVDQIAAIPMPISLEIVDTQTLQNRVNTGDYTCALITMDDPQDYTQFVNGSAMFGYQNGQAQQQYQNALKQASYAEYREQLREFDKIVSEDAASAWLYTAKDYVVAKKTLQGLPTNLTSWRLPLGSLHG